MFVDKYTPTQTARDGERPGLREESEASVGEVYGTTSPLPLFQMPQVFFCLRTGDPTANQYPEIQPYQTKKISRIRKKFQPRIK
jgi:hypothetical protein